MLPVHAGPAQSNAAKRAMWFTAVSLTREYNSGCDTWDGALLAWWHQMSIFVSVSCMMIASNMQYDITALL